MGHIQLGHNCNPFGNVDNSHHADIVYSICNIFNLRKGLHDILLGAYVVRNRRQHIEIKWLHMKYNSGMW